MIPQLPVDLARDLGEIRRRLDDLESGRRLVSSSIGAGGLRVHGGGRITVEDDDGNVRVEITGGTITVSDADGTPVWTSDVNAWAGTVAPTVDATVASGTSWVDLASWTWVRTSIYVEVGALVSPASVDTEGELRILDDSDAFGAETITTAVGLNMNVTGLPYVVRLDGPCSLPVGTDYQRVRLQGRALGGTDLFVEPLSASFAA